MKKAESQVPSQTRYTVTRCNLGESRSRPKIQSPMKVASSMNAPRPSIASGVPKMSPT